MRKLLALFIALVCAIYAPQAVVATTTETSEVDGTASIASGATTITLSSVRQFSHVIIKLSSGSSSMYVTVNHGATASSSNFLIDSGGTLSLGFGCKMSPTDQINYYGNGVTGTISYVALP